VHPVPVLDPIAQRSVALAATSLANNFSLPCRPDAGPRCARRSRLDYYCNGGLGMPGVGEIRANRTVGVASMALERLICACADSHAVMTQSVCVYTPQALSLCSSICPNLCTLQRVSLTVIIGLG